MIISSPRGIKRVKSFINLLFLLSTLSREQAGVIRFVIVVEAPAAGTSQQQFLFVLFVVAFTAKLLG